MKYILTHYEGDTFLCGCPIRTLPPPIPETLPFNLETANPRLIEEWILKHFASSAFNCCEHQALPLMDKSPPLKFHVEDNAKPHAVFKPSPIPINYMGTIKSEIDRCQTRCYCSSTGEYTC